MHCDCSLSDEIFDGCKDCPLIYIILFAIDDIFIAPKHLHHVKKVLVDYFHCGFNEQNYYSLITTCFSSELSVQYSLILIVPAQH